MFRKMQIPVYYLILYIQVITEGSPIIGEKARRVEKDEFPFVVSLSKKYPTQTVNPVKKHICGGALITAKHVLTAAHCLKDITPEEIVIKFDKDLVESETYNVKKWKTYNDWAKINITETDDETSNDIAVVELFEKVSSSIKPAVLSSLPEAELYGKKVVTAGWGLTKNEMNQKIFLPYLLTAEVTVLKAMNCLRNWYDDMINNMLDTTHMFLCTAARPPVYLGCGDSGSPLFLESNEIIAVNKGDCYIKRGLIVMKKQNVHMSINYFREFITDVICKHSRCCIQ